MVVIKNMKMPKGCDKCRFHHTTVADKTFCQVTENTYPSIIINERPNGCPLKEIEDVLYGEDITIPKTGHWIDMNHYEEWWDKEYKCSECGGRMIGDSKYCPYCGSKNK